MSEPSPVFPASASMPAPVREPIPAPPLTGNVDPSDLPFMEDYAFIDTETTGIDPDIDGICEIAIVRFREGRPEVWHSLVNPGHPIPPTASAVHNITDDDVKDAPSIKDLVPRIRELLDGAMVVAHNAKFDAGFVQPQLGEDYDPSKWICSVRLSRHVFKQAPAHGNMVLRYWLKTSPRSEGLGAHRAIDDVWVSIENFRHMLRECHLSHGLKSLVEVRAKANEVIPVTIFPFGKHAEKPLVDIPTDYFDWALKNMEDMDADLKASVINELHRRGVTVKDELGDGGPGDRPVRPATVMPFGKYKDKPLNIVPTDYFNFLRDKGIRLDESLRAGIDAELKRRAAAGSAQERPDAGAQPAAQPARGGLFGARAASSASPPSAPARSEASGPTRRPLFASQPTQAEEDDLAPPEEMDDAAAFDDAHAEEDRSVAAETPAAGPRPANLFNRSRGARP